VKIHAVSGEIQLSELGPTMLHEHKYADFEPEFGNYDAIIADEQKLVSELRLYREATGLAIVDVTPSHAGSNPRAMARICHASPVRLRSASRGSKPARIARPDATAVRLRPARRTRARAGRTLSA
jgi:predicted metal-dependent phosphotriesterase family hydrolase